MPGKYILDNMYVPEDITIKDVIKWIEANFGHVWEEYVNSFPPDWNQKFMEVITTDALCYCTFGSNEGIYLHIEDSRSRKIAIVGKTLNAGDAKWYECCFSLARIGLELREIY
ncbi:MAG: hypothetical protein KAJ39_07050 [Gammaproteobacteria bacterium]|nr:hypothetical protein [Gammaproteobacteria bacterium]